MSRTKFRGGRQAAARKLGVPLKDLPPNKKLRSLEKREELGMAPLKPTIPFEPDEKILLIGEGDFTFAESLVIEHHCTDVTATTFEKEEDLYEKYEGVEERVAGLKESEVDVLFTIDATKLDRTKALAKKGSYDRIIFNFPHVGGQKSTDVNYQVRLNQAMLSSFLEKAQSLLEFTAGSIIVTLFEGEPYTLWNIKDLARSVGLGLKTSWAFQASAYPGYKHARTLGDVKKGGKEGEETSKTAWKGEERAARSYEFVWKDAIFDPPKAGEGKKGKNKKRKRGEDSDSEPDRP